MWVWAKLSAARWLDAWEERFRGDPNLVLRFLPGGRTLRVERYCRSRAEAEAVQRQFGGAVREVRREAWAAAGTARPPLKIRDRLLVTAESSPAALRRLAAGHPRRAILSLPAEMAFGTGDHATTATCLRLLADLARERRWRPASAAAVAAHGDLPRPAVADLGTGTGVLALAARLLGAASVWACDFDPLSVEVARRNVRRNHLPEVRVEPCDVRTWQPPARFDVVLANLFSGVLIEAMPVLARALAPSGDLILSGILRDQALEVFAAAAANGIGFRRVVRRGKWISARGGWADSAAAG